MLTNIDILIAKSIKELDKKFEKALEISIFNQEKILNAFIDNRISPRHFSQTTGYGYDDIGRDTLSKLFSDIFKTEAGIVSPLITSGTHAIASCLFGLLRPYDKLLSITGNPYDTLLNAINGENINSLKDNLVEFKKINLFNNDIDYSKLDNLLSDNEYKVIFIGRSRGYELRNALSIKQIEKACTFIKERSNAHIVVDNCYGEFVDKYEPSEVGADIVVGSLIKNPGGGIAPTGGYIVGKEKLLEQISYRLTAPGIGFEVGSYNSSYQNFYQGLFLAPSVVKSAIMSNLLFGKVFNSLGFKTMPEIKDYPNDIIRSIEFNTEEEVVEFCQKIQLTSPIDGYVKPEPWDMPGYTSKVIMAAGSFNQGASIELSCDSPIKKPYIAYLQGALTFEHAVIAIKRVLENIIKHNSN